MTLLTFVAESQAVALLLLGTRLPPLSVSISCLHGTQQQTHCMLLLWSYGQTDILCEQCQKLSGNLVGEDDIASSPTFELIVEGEEAEEVELESRCATTATASSAAAAAAMTAVAVTTLANKRRRMNDASAAVNIASLAECITPSGFGTGLLLFLPSRQCLFLAYFVFSQIFIIFLHCLNIAVVL